jgi:hypothetical protein
LSEKHGKELRRLYQIIVKYPESFEKLVNFVAMPLFLELLEEFQNSNESKQSRNRIELIVDETKSEKYVRDWGNHKGLPLHMLWCCIVGAILFCQFIIIAFTHQYQFFKRFL